MQIDRGRIGAAVAEMFDAASTEEAGSLTGLLSYMQRTRGRTILIDREAALPPGVSGRWVALETQDLIQLQHDGPAPTWTLMHELGHLVLGHHGRRVDHADGGGCLVLDGPDESALAGETATELEEAEAEAFAGLFGRRLRQAARSAAPAVQARLDETLG